MRLLSPLSSEPLTTPSPALPTASPAVPLIAKRHHGHGGRPRSEASRRAILDAVADLVTTVTPAQITIAAIAARAGTSKSTIYRWWTSRAELLFEALARITVPTLEFPDAADTATALATQLEALQRLFAEPYLGRLIIALTIEAQENPDTARALRRLWLAPRRDSAARVLQRGIARGEIRADIDLEIAIDQLFAPLYHRALYYSGEDRSEDCEESLSGNDGGSSSAMARYAAKDVKQFLAGAAARAEHSNDSNGSRRP